MLSLTKLSKTLSGVTPLLISDVAPVDCLLLSLFVSKDYDVAFLVIILDLADTPRC